MQLLYEKCFSACFKSRHFWATVRDSDISDLFNLSGTCADFFHHDLKHNGTLCLLSLKGRMSLSETSTPNIGNRNDRK